jgi:CheY-like chemotaxis protein
MKSAPTELNRGGKSVSEQPIPVRILVVSPEIQTIDTLCHFMEKAAMYVEVCSDMSSATRKLCHSKFEGVAIDFHEKTKAEQLMRTLHNMTSHGGAVVLAILDRNDDIQSAFKAGANFILERPFTAKILVPTLKASYSLMLRERRRYFRCPVQIPVSLITNSRFDILATSVNISEGGMALCTGVPLQVGEHLQVTMTLPGTNNPAKMKADVCWADNNGRLGLQFVQPSASVVDLLQSWLFERLQESQPEQILVGS